jgi:Zn-finger nucleic acid-binding protein
MGVAARGDLESTLHQKCPRCGTAELVAHLLGETNLDECARCGGVWIDAVTLEKLIKSRDEQAAVLSGGGPYLEVEAYAHSTSALEVPRYLPCPECSQLMNRKNFGGNSGVIVDICKAHGTWFDRDELGRIVQFVMKGGLDQSRRRELEQLEQRLKAKRAEIASVPTIPTYEAPDGGDLVRLLLDTIRDFFR